VHAKDMVLIFKNITKDKVVPKEYLIGLSFKEFEEALLRIAIKHKSIFNIINERIKDKIEEKAP
jgi:3-isopropylmalate dehydratase small subunit